MYVYKCLKQPHSSLSDAEANLNGELTHLSLSYMTLNKVNVGWRQAHDNAYRL